MGDIQAFIVSNNKELRQNIKTALAETVVKKTLMEGDLENAFFTVEKEGFVALLLDWSIDELPNITRFLQKYRKLKDRGDIPIVAISKEVSGTLLAVSFEYEIPWVILASEVVKELPGAIKAIMNDASKPPPPLKMLLKKMEEAAQAGNMQGVETLTIELYKKFPENTRVQVEYGNLCLRKQKIDEAREIAQKVLSAEEDNLRAKNLYARICMHEKKFDMALKFLQEAEELSPKAFDRMIMLGQVYHSIGEFKKAKDNFVEALEMEPESLLARKGLGAVELTTGEISKGLVLLGGTSEEESASIFNNSAIMAIGQGEFERAIRLYETAKLPLKDPKLKSRILFNMGLAYEKWGKPDEAAPLFEEAVKLDPTYEKATAHLQKIKQAKE